MNAKRDELLVLAVAQKMSYDETQSLLRKYAQAELYARDRRDSIIIWALYHKKELAEINKLCRAYYCRELAEGMDNGKRLDESFEEENASGSS